MKVRLNKRRIAEAAVGASVGATIAGPIGAVAGGIAAGHVESGLDALSKLKPSTKRKNPGAENPIVHAHLKRILVPMDFSPPSRRALRFALEWALLFGAEVCLLHVIGPTAVVGEFGTVPIGRVHRDLARRVKEALQELARLEFPEIVPVSVKVCKGTPYDEIVRAAIEWNADLILMATHGRGGLKHALLGSTTERVVRHASCPVLTLRRSPTK